MKNWFKKEIKETKLLLRSVPSWLVAIFVVSVIGMNLLANKSIDIGKLTWIALDCGTLISWIAFFSMDIIVKRFGAKAGNKISLFAIFINLVIAVLFMVASYIPGIWAEAISQDSEVVNIALNNTFKGTWFILLGSMTAFIVSAFINNATNVLIGKSFKKNQSSFKCYAVRSYVSTMIGQFVDNLVFTLIVSLNFFGWSILQCITGSLVLALIELLLEIVFSPIGYKISKKWDKENVGKEYLDSLEKITK